MIGDYIRQHFETPHLQVVRGHDVIGEVRLVRIVEVAVPWRARRSDTVLDHQIAESRPRLQNAHRLGVRQQVEVAAEHLGAGVRVQHFGRLLRLPEAIRRVGLGTVEPEAVQVAEEDRSTAHVQRDRLELAVRDDDVPFAPGSLARTPYARPDRGPGSTCARKWRCSCDSDRRSPRSNRQIPEGRERSH